jgi:hypothetical protein
MMCGAGYKPEPGRNPTGFLASYLAANGGGAAASSGEASSGGIGFGQAATRQTQSARMQRTASAANFMALFGVQPQGA